MRTYYSSKRALHGPRVPGARGGAPLTKFDRAAAARVAKAESGEGRAELVVSISSASWGPGVPGARCRMQERRRKGASAGREARG